MISQLWRERLTYIAMSAFVAWHTLAMVIAPAPNVSAVETSLRSVFQPYLSLFRLDNQWDFFAPNPNRLAEFRYTIEDAAGNRHTFVPASELSWLRPEDIWFKSWHYAIFEAPEVHTEFAAALLCRKHAELHPVSITLLQALQEDFAPDDYLEGKRPLDPEFVTVTTLKRAQCTDSPR